jgi:serine/threonine protein kinase
LRAEHRSPTIIDVRIRDGVILKEHNVSTASNSTVSTSTGNALDPATSVPVVAGYHDLDPIGRGGSASVHRATADADGSVVAIKILHGLSPGAVRRFEREAAVMESLADIDGVVPVIETGAMPSGAPYLVMPYFENGSLEDVMSARGALDVDTAQTLVRRVGTVLTEVHRMGVYHRDLKPANILLDSEMRPWVCDFGVAELEDRVTVSTTVSYTLGYCPPEAFLMGRRGANGVAVDVYSLTATLWALLAGRPPFSDADADQHAADDAAGDGAVAIRLRAELPSPGPDIPDPLIEVIALGTHPDPGRRPASMSAFVDLLASATRRTAGLGLATAGPGVATPLRPSAPAPGAMTVSRPGDEATQRESPLSDRPRRAARLWAALAAIAALALVAGVVIWTEGRTEASPWMLVAASGGDGGFHLIEPGEQPTAANRLELDAERINSLSMRSDPEASSGNTIFAVVGTGSGESLAVIDVPSATTRLLAENRLDEAWTFPDRVLVQERLGNEGDADPDVMCVAVTTVGGQRQLGSGRACTPSPDGLHVAITGDDDLRIVRTTDGREVAAVEGFDQRQSAGWSAFSPDGTTFAVRGAEGVVSVFDLASGAEIDRLSIRPTDAACGYCLQWNAGGALLAVDQNQRDIELWSRGAEPVTVDGYAMATFRSVESDEVLLWNEETNISMLDADRRVLHVSDTAYWVTVDSLSSPSSTRMGALLIDGADVLRVESDASTTKMATLSSAVAGGSSFRAVQVGDVTAASFAVVGGGRDVVAFDTDGEASARWSGPDAPINFVRLDDSIVAAVTPEGSDDDVLLALAPTGIDAIDIAGNIGGLAGFGDDVYFTRKGQENWVDRLDRSDAEVDTVLNGHEIVAFGVART